MFRKLALFIKTQSSQIMLVFSVARTNEVISKIGGKHIIVQGVLWIRCAVWLTGMFSLCWSVRYHTSAVWFSIRARNRVKCHIASKLYRTYRKTEYRRCWWEHLSDIIIQELCIFSYCAPSVYIWLDLVTTIHHMFQWTLALAGDQWVLLGGFLIGRPQRAEMAVRGPRGKKVWESLCFFILPVEQHFIWKTALPLATTKATMEIRLSGVSGQACLLASVFLWPLLRRSGTLQSFLKVIWRIHYGAAISFFAHIVHPFLYREMPPKVITLLSTLRFQKKQSRVFV